MKCFKIFILLFLLLHLFDDRENTIDDEDLGFVNAGDEWDQETQDIIDSEEDEADYENEL